MNTQTNSVTTAETSVTLPVAFFPVSKQKDTKIPEFHRLAKVRARNVGDVKEADRKESQFAFIPLRSANFVQAFITDADGLELVTGYIESLEDDILKAALDSGKSLTTANFTMAAIIEAAMLTSAAGRLTKESITEQFGKVWQNRIAHSLAISRDVKAAAILLAEVSEEETKTAGYDETKTAEYLAKVSFWAAESGQRWLKIAGNYLKFFLQATSKGNKETFPDTATKDKVILAASYLDDDVLTEKLKAKLEAIPVFSADEAGL